MTKGWPSPNGFSTEGLAGGIGSDEHHVLDHRLCGQHAVKRVAMLVVHSACLEGMSQSNGKPAQPRFLDEHRQPGQDAVGPRELAQTELGCNFPPRRGAYPRRISRILTSLQNTSGKSLVVGKPQQ